MKLQIHLVIVACVSGSSRNRKKTRPMWGIIEEFFQGWKGCVCPVMVGVLPDHDSEFIRKLGKSMKDGWSSICGNCVGKCESHLWVEVKSGGRLAQVSWNFVCNVCF